nr:MAG TPA: hypothetical protein [Caudoviricetes sp.]
MHEKHADSRQGQYIYFLLFFLFVKIPYIKIGNYFVLSCGVLFFHIYYIINQIFKHCTIFVQNRTIRTFMHEIAFCTQSEKLY